MLVGIIKEGKNNYYINFDNNMKEISVILSNAKITRTLTKNEALNLLETILSSKLTYKEEKDNYSIYLDESNNTRYFRNGIEDFNMFLNNNGKNAILYDEANKNNKNNSVKRYKIAIDLLVFELILSTSLPLSFSSLKYNEQMEPFVYHNMNSIDVSNLSINEIKELIYGSKYLSLEDKEFLYNEDLLNDVLEISQNERNYVLRRKLENIRIEYYNKEMIDNRDYTGYYNTLDFNTIYLLSGLKNDKEKYNDVLSHEFIHLLQDNNEYTYIIEGCAEIISNEYYFQTSSSYSDLVKRVKVLMEIIGPKPVIECNFKVGNESFENAIHEYLDDEDANKLLSLFTSTPDYMAIDNNERIVNKEIDKLLAKMYFNKTGKNIEDDLLMNLLFNVSIENRIYFNKNRDEYYNEYPLYIEKEKLDIMDFEYALSLDSISELVLHKSTSQERNGKRLVGYTLYTIDDINDVVLDKNDYIEIIFNDDTRGEVSYDFDNNSWGKVERYKVISYTTQSIAEKFPEQCKKKEEIEILDMEENQNVMQNRKTR